MFHFDVTMEDCRIIAAEVDRDKITDIEHPMSVRFIDVPTSRVVHKIMPMAAVASIIAYGMSGQDGEDYTVTYHEADTACDDVPPECRPIP